MNIHKKAAAFLAALLICTTVAFPGGYAFADEEENTQTSVSDEADTSDDDAEEETPAEEEVFTSGDFSYTKLADNKICIVDCSSTAEELVVPETLDGFTVSELGKTAFGKNYKEIPFDTITLPKTIEYISEFNPFLYCELLTEVKVDPESKYYTAEDGILYTKDKKKLVTYPMHKEGTSFTVPDGVEAIGSSAIYNTKLLDIKVPDSLKTIGNHAFSFNHITSIDLSKTSVEVLEVMCFAECHGLTEVLLPKTLSEIELGAFINCTALADITLPDGIYKIGQYAFRDTALTKIVIPDSVEEISYCALGYKTNTEGKEYAVDDFVVIGKYASAAHRYCTDTDTDADYANNFIFKTPEQAKREEELLALDTKEEGDYQYAIVDGKAVLTLCSSIDEVLTVPDSFGGAPLKEIYPAAFTGCSSREIIIPEGVTLIKEVAFYQCQARRITLPKSLEEIGESAFGECKTLVEVDCGGAVKIGDGAFLDCSALQKITFSGNCTEIAGEAPFATCGALEEFVVTDGSGSYSAKSGVLFTGDGSELILYPPAKKDKSYKVPKGVKKIRTYSFLSCSALEDIVISKSVEEIEDNAIYDCQNLKSLCAYKNLKVIGDMAFGYSYVTNTDSETGETDSGSILTSGFKLYTSKGTPAYDYAKKNEIEVVTGTIRIGRWNVRTFMLGVLGGFIAVLAAAFIGIRASGKKDKQDNARPVEAKKKSEKKEKSVEGAEKDNEA